MKYKSTDIYSQILLLPEGGSQILQVLSMDPVAINEQSQLNWALLISALCPISEWIRLKKKKILIHIFISLSKSVDVNKNMVFLENIQLISSQSIILFFLPAIFIISEIWMNVNEVQNAKLYVQISQNLLKRITDNRPTYLPELMSHTDTVWSKEPVISCVPVELNEREIISAEWPCQQQQQYHTDTCWSIWI